MHKRFILTVLFLFSPYLVALLLAPQISSRNLDRVRKLKSGMTRLTARVQKVWFPVHCVSFGLLPDTCLGTYLTVYAILYAILSSNLVAVYKSSSRYKLAM